MRVPMVFQWLQGRRHDPVRARTARTYATGLACIRIHLGGVGAPRQPGGSAFVVASCV
jgi:hypothetical protein